MIVFINQLKYLFLFLFGIVSFSSCLVSSRSSVDVFNKNEYAGTVSVRTVKVPMLITKPIIKSYLRHEGDVPKEITNLISGLKKISISYAQTKNTHLINDFRLAVDDLKGQEWLSVHNGKQWVYLKGEQNAKDVIKRITVAVSSPEDNKLVFVNMKCNLTPDQLSKLINFALDSDEGKKLLKNTPVKEAKL